VVNIPRGRLFDSAVKKLESVPIREIRGKKLQNFALFVSFCRNPLPYGRPIFSFFRPRRSKQFHVPWLKIFPEIRVNIRGKNSAFASFAYFAVKNPCAFCAFLRPLLIRAHT